ncbi:uncharacterized protein METZ01_LOCUS497357, partial [marine metagenome]
DVVEWFTLGDALTSLNYRNEVQVLELASELISLRIRDGQ